MNRIIAWLGGLALILTLLTPSPAHAAFDRFSLRIERDDYVPAPLEPADGTYLGAYVLQDEHIDCDMERFNELLGRRHVSFFKYVGYGRPFPSEWVEAVKAAGAIPQIAWEPNGGLDAVRDDAYLRGFARAMREADTPVFLRFASEMNGTWCAYSGDPEAYKSTWRLVHDVMEEEAPQAIMLWSVFTFPEQTMLDYYPGDAYVDWVGVNIYNVVYHNDDLQAPAAGEDPLRLLDYVYDRFSPRKPICLSEYGATHYTTTDESFHIDFAADKIRRLYQGIATRYPRVKAIWYFDVNNLLNAPAGRRINNYAVTTQPRITQAYRTAISDAHFLDEIVMADRSPRPETFTFNSRNVLIDGQLHTDLLFFTDLLGLVVQRLDEDAVTLSDETKSIRVPLRTARLSRSFYGKHWTFQSVPLRTVADAFGYTLRLDWENREVTLLAAQPTP